MEQPSSTLPNYARNNNVDGSKSPQDVLNGTLSAAALDRGDPDSASAVRL